MDGERTPEELVTGLLKLLAVRPDGEDRFTGRRKRGGVGRVFGGEVIAQALNAAEATVPDDRPAHSLHAYFLRGGSEEHSSDYQVTRDFDGGSFSNRRVVASQQGRPIFNLTASFQRHEEGLHHIDAEMPDVPPPEELEPEVEVRRRFAEQARPEARHHFLSQRPVEMRAVEGRHWMNPVPAPPRSHSWFKTVAALPDDPSIHRAILAYASDMTLLGTCALPHGLSWARGEVVSASLDHAVWFHEPFRADEWLLYATDSPWSGGGRGFNRGRIFTRDGRLVASVAQEGMIRKVTPKA
ncbi:MULTISPECIES: acyl-CoA thioesterase domain-containing protein [unclassified Novosphingobium]|uniref:acyl-CoA thioesterase n=1 Tax=unclassified Novosphingobium TaxID=2644732 RepID=UPI000EE0F80A|nr:MULTISPECIES: acyl-CoA thioesterase domain-containing protein [unclassified Novosphingobium]HCF24107.1 acyl-CoA thioesterase II [Novosphingobium sp.]HQV04112.1 thioesterase family protein [Novosphingobium sp.]